MKISRFFVFLFFCFPLWSYSSFEELGKNNELLEKNSFQFSNANLKVIQKRWLEKGFLSEIGLSLSPVLKGFNYTDPYSMDLSYRFFISDYFGVSFRYSYYNNPISLDGKDELNLRGQAPVELLYYNDQSYLAGIEWYPFYGKAVLYKQLVYFDLYLSALAGQIELFDRRREKTEKAPVYSLTIGIAQWWHKHFNTRVEAQAFYYKYLFSNELEKKEIQEYFYKISISAGVLF